DHIRLRSLDSQRLGPGILFRVIPAPGLLQRRKLEEHDTRGLPTAFELLEFPAPDEELAAVLLDGSGNALAVLLETGSILHVDVDDEVSRHGDLLDDYRTTSSALSRSSAGMFKPRALAAAALMTISNLTASSTGRSPARAPRRILYTCPAARRHSSTKSTENDIKPPLSGNSRSPYTAGSLKLAASATSERHSRLNIASPGTKRASHRLLFIALKAASNSVGARMPSSWSARPRRVPSRSTALKIFGWIGLFRFRRKATRLVRGAMSR